MRQDYPRKPGKPGKSSDYQRILRQRLITSRINASQNTRTIHTQQGTFVEYVPDDSAGGSEAETVLQRYRVKSIASTGTYLSCRIWDGANEGAIVNVAIPPELRGGTVTSGNITRTVTVTQVQGTEEITPAYAINDEIWAIKAAGKTGVTVSSAELEWIDANVDGRSWQFPQRVVEVCVGNQTRRMIIRASEPVV